MVAVATALDAAGVPLIEVTHGDGLGGASVNYGFPSHSDEEYLRGVIPKLTRAKVSALLLPGIGTVEHLQMANDCGVATIRVATHCTEADVSEQHIALSRKLGLDTVGFLMMAHMIEPAAAARAGEADGELRRELHLLHRFGRLHAARRRHGADRRCCARSSRPRPRSAFTAITTWRMGIANSLAAIEAGAARIDGSVAGLGAGAGNTPLEVFIAVLDRMGVQTGVDVFKLMDVAEDLVVPMMDQPIRIDRDSLILGYAGVYSSFLLLAKRARRQVRRAVRATSWSSSAGTRRSADRKT